MLEQDEGVQQALGSRPHDVDTPAGILALDGSFHAAK
jgi:hypothetical protein